MVIQIPYESKYCFWITSFTQQTVGIPFFKINKWQIGIILLMLSLKSNNKHLVRSWHMDNYSIHTFKHITPAYNSHLSFVWIFFDRYKNEIFLHINVTDTLIIIHLPAFNRSKPSMYINTSLVSQATALPATVLFLNPAVLLHVTPA